MSALSPAAQVVYDAAWAAFWSTEAMAPNDAEVIAAAALRTASDRTEYLIGDVHHPKFAEGVLAAGDLLERIATELDGGNSTSQED